MRATQIHGKAKLLFGGTGVIIHTALVKSTASTAVSFASDCPTNTGGYKSNFNAGAPGQWTLGLYQDASRRGTRRVRGSIPSHVVVEVDHVQICSVFR